MNCWPKIPLLLLSLAFPGIVSGNSLNIYLEDFPPYNFVEDGKIQGINTELVEYMCEATETDCRFTALPWTRAWHLALNESDTGLYSTGMSSARRNLFKWVGPLVSSKTSLYKLKSRDDIIFNKDTKFDGFSIAVVRNTVTKSMLLEQGFASPENFVEFSYLEEYIPLFFAGKVDMIPGSVIASPYHLPKLGFSYSDVEVVISLSDEGLGNYLALNKSVSDDIVDRMNLALIKFKEQGKLQGLIEKYSPTTTGK